MNKIRKHIHLFHLLSKASPQQRKALLRTATEEQIKSLCEICKNLLLGNIPSIPLKKLKHHKRVIRSLACRKISLSKKKKILSKQTGGFLPLILPAVLSLLNNIIKT